MHWKGEVELHLTDAGAMLILSFKGGDRNLERALVDATRRDVSRTYERVGGKHWYMAEHRERTEE